MVVAACMPCRTAGAAPACACLHGRARPLLCTRKNTPEGAGAPLSWLLHSTQAAAMRRRPLQAAPWHVLWQPANQSITSLWSPTPEAGHAWHTHQPGPGQQGARKAAGQAAELAPAPGSGMVRVLSAVQHSWPAAPATAAATAAHGREPCLRPVCPSQLLGRWLHTPDAEPPSQGGRQPLPTGCRDASGWPRNCYCCCRCCSGGGQHCLLLNGQAVSPGAAGDQRCCAGRQAGRQWATCSIRHDRRASG